MSDTTWLSYDQRQLNAVMETCGDNEIKWHNLFAIAVRVILQLYGKERTAELLRSMADGVEGDKVIDTPDHVDN